MTPLRTLAAFTAIALLASCGVAGRYQSSALTFGEHIDIRRNHTFTYGCASDTFDYYDANGTWTLDPEGVLVTTVSEGEGTSKECLKTIQRWSVTAAGITAEGGNELLRRK